MDQAPTSTTIAVSERMDRLELRMPNRSLHSYRQILTVDERHEVIKQRRDLIRRRRDVFGTRRAESVPANPVLLGPHNTTEVLITRPAKQSPVNLKEILEHQITWLASKRDRALHRTNVADDLARRVIATNACRGPRQPSLPHDETLNATGSD